MAQRYSRLAEIINLQRPRQVIEIGTWSGERAIELIAAGVAVRPDVHYLGFDLFEQGTPALNERELNVKHPTKIGKVEKRLQDFTDCFPSPPYKLTFQLLAGDTRDTLPGMVPPFPWGETFVFIDGGHSIETIRNDYDAVKQAAVIVFDDYYTPDDRGGWTNIDEFGCNRLVDEIGGFYLSYERDPVAGGGCVQMAVVRHENT